MAEERTIVLTPGAIIRYSINSDGCLIITYKEGNEKQLSDYFHLIGKLIDEVFIMNNGVDNHGSHYESEGTGERNEQGSPERNQGG